jgi:hypothetical protein
MNMMYVSNYNPLNPTQKAKKHCSFVGRQVIEFNADLEFNRHTCDADNTGYKIGH